MSPLAGLRTPSAAFFPTARSPWAKTTTPASRAHSKAAASRPHSEGRVAAGDCPARLAPPDDTATPPSQCPRHYPASYIGRFAQGPELIFPPRRRKGDKDPRSAFGVRLRSPDRCVGGEAAALQGGSLLPPSSRNRERSKSKSPAWRADSKAAASRSHSEGGRKAKRQLRGRTPKAAWRRWAGGQRLGSWSMTSRSTPACFPRRG